MLQRLRAPWKGGQASIRVAGPAAFGTYSEDRPLSELERNGWLVVADARLDDKEALRATLRLEPGTDDDLLILHAYANWGQACLDHLRGEFAFAVWDPRAEEMFCARDPFGVKPFYYLSQNGTFAFGSELKALRALPGVGERVLEVRVAEFLKGLPPPTEATLYTDLSRLPPGGAGVVTQRGLAISTHYRVQLPPVHQGEVVHQFAELFERAIGRRMDDAAAPAAMLSGGLDSSAIASMAARRLKPSGRTLTTFSLVFDATPQWSERNYIEQVANSSALRPILLSGDGFDPLSRFPELLDVQDGLFLSPNLALIRPVYAEAARRGCSVLLDGHGGDEVASHGYGRLRELAEARAWSTLWRNLRSVAKHQGLPPWRLFAAYLNRFGPGAYKRHAIARRIKERLPHFRTPHPRPLTLLEQSFARRTEATEPPKPAWRSARHAELDIIETPLRPYAFEVLNRLGSSEGVEPRYPFWDRDLVEFCLSLRMEDKLDRGFDRVTLRRAIDGLLPPSVQWRVDKLDFSGLMARGLLMHHDEAIREIAAGQGGTLNAYVDGAHVQRLYSGLLSGEVSGVQQLWRVLALQAWLKQAKTEGLEIAS
jgi:asparagine synthase (glutamine-hydrolysing)